MKNNNKIPNYLYYILNAEPKQKHQDMKYNLILLKAQN